jgi:hypothetical protein
MTRLKNQQARYRTNGSGRVKGTLHRVVMAVSLSLIVLAPSPFLHAQQASLAVHPGWDKKDPRFTSGYVLYGLTTRGKCDGPKLLLTYGLRGAESNTPYKLYIGLFNLPPAGLNFFGAPRYNHGVYTRDGVTARNDGFIVGDFKTNDRGDGEAQVELDLTDVPSGTYDAQFTWGTLGVGSIVYRTGEKYGVGFARIKIP